MTTMQERPRPICRAIVDRETRELLPTQTLGRDLGCGRTPEQLDDYTELAEEQGMTPSQFVVMEEGTYNEENGHFLCDACYIRAGSPAYHVSTGRQWVAP